MSNVASVITFLVQLNTSEHAHSGASLLQHLVGTATILEDWQRPTTTVAAGLTHSLFHGPWQRRLGITPAQKRTLSDLLGPEAFRLGVLYEARSKTTLYTEQAHIRVSVGDAQELAHVVAANWLEQRPRLATDKRDPLAERLLLRLTPAARHAASRAMGIQCS
jgi:hypothetical protein